MDHATGSSVPFRIELRHLQLLRPQQLLFLRPQHLGLHQLLLLHFKHFLLTLLQKHDLLQLRLLLQVQRLHQLLLHRLLVHRRLHRLQ